MRLKALLLAAAAIVMLALLAQFVHPIVAASRDSETALVTKIIDGDTIIVEGGRDVRLLGMDADERGHPCYKLASERLEQLVLNKEVRLESDSRDKDKYGRYLRWIWLGDELINERLVVEGMAVARHGDDDKYAARITAAEAAAIEDKVGCKWQGNAER